MVGELLSGFEGATSSPLPSIEQFNQSSSTQADVFDVAVVGAGPAGAVTAFYLARNGRRVLLLEQARFPRDKVCGDRLTPGAQEHLLQMGVLAPLLERGDARWVR